MSATVYALAGQGQDLALPYPLLQGEMGFNGLIRYTMGIEVRWPIREGVFGNKAQ